MAAREIPRRGAPDVPPAPAHGFRCSTPPHRPPSVLSARGTPDGAGPGASPVQKALRTGRARTRHRGGTTRPAPFPESPPQRPAPIPVLTPAGAFSVLGDRGRGAHPRETGAHAHGGFRAGGVPAGTRGRRPSGGSRSQLPARPRTPCPGSPRPRPGQAAPAALRPARPAPGLYPAARAVPGRRRARAAAGKPTGPFPQATLARGQPPTDCASAVLQRAGGSHRPTGQCAS